MVKRYTGVRIYPRSWTRAVAFAITLTLLYCLDYFVGVHGLIMLAIGGIMGEIIFLALLIVMRELKAKHIWSVWKKLRDDKD